MSSFGPKHGGNRWGGAGYDAYGRRLPWWRAFARGDNPMTWSVPIGVVGGIVVRVSLIYILWMILRLVSAEETGWTFKLWSLGSLFVLVLLHEFGHCIACRWVGGQADEILMWMLGGLASCRPPHNWKASLITTIGGPAVNVLLLPVFAGVMMSLGVPIGSLVFNPWDKSIGTAWFDAFNAMRSAVPHWLAYGLFTLHVSNLSLLLFNLLLAFFPFDGGRIVQELLWRKYGYTRSMYIATGVGLGGAAVVGLFALYVGSLSLVLIAIFGGYTCYQQRMQIKFMGGGAGGLAGDGPWSDDGEGWKVGSGRASGFGGAGADRPAKVHTPKAVEKARKAAEAERARALADSAELDRILAKIKDKGMASLSKSEESFLRRSTQKSRGE